MKTPFSQMLRLLRQSNGWSQREMAERLHLDRSSYAYYETGKTRPDYETLVSIAKLYRVSVDFLLGEEAPFSSTKQEFIQQFLSMSREEQARLLRALEDLAE